MVIAQQMKYVFFEKECISASKKVVSLFFCVIKTMKMCLSLSLSALSFL